MTEEPVSVVAEPTESELLAQLDIAMKSKDFKQVAVVSRKIDQMVTAKEKVEKAALQAELDTKVGKVKDAITKAVKPLVDSGELDAADGIWYSYDFGEQAPTVRLMKSATKTRTATSDSSGGRKFDISTDELLEKHGSKVYKDSGLSFAQAYESSTDKNWRYAIRQALLKAEGTI